MNEFATKKAIAAALKDFSAKPVGDAAVALFEALGYKSQKRLALRPNTADNFLATFAQSRPLDRKQALTEDWQSVDCLFQLTDEEVRAAAQGNQQFLFESKGKYDGAVIESYLFFAVTLKQPHYPRTQLSGITRAVNRLFPMPVMLLFRHGDTLTLAVINRRFHKRDEAKDVLEKVTLIKDIRTGGADNPVCSTSVGTEADRIVCPTLGPHRAHIDILFDLSFDALHEKHAFTNFVELHAAWQKTLDSSELNKRFYQEIANWYFWSLGQVRFPEDAPKDASGKDAISLIRLLTRLIFCCFIKEKGLVPDTLFSERELAALLKGLAPRDAANRDSNPSKKTWPSTRNCSATSLRICWPTTTRRPAPWRGKPPAPFTRRASPWATWWTKPCRCICPTR